MLDEGEMENGLDFAAVTVTLSYTLDRREFMDIQQTPDMGRLHIRQAVKVWIWKAIRTPRCRVVEGREAVKVWIWKAIRTPRCRSEIYTWAYGSEFESLVGQAYSDCVKTAEAPRYLRECLLVNPYITAVKDITVSFQAAKLTVRGKAVTIYGEVSFDAAV